MSTMTITPHLTSQVGQVGGVSRPHGRAQAAAQVPGQAPARVRLTRRGRLAMTVGFLTVLLAVMMTFGGSWATATLSGGTTEPVTVVEVQPGDTLYDIASEVAAPGEVREMVYRIRELNSLPGAQISVGQRLAVPHG